jgi:acetoin utilization protein AcuC
VAGGRWLLTGGGGYEHVQVVPRTWTHLLFEAAGRPLDPESATPESWRRYVAETTGRKAPETMTEGGQGHFDPKAAFENGYNPGDPLDQAILATRNAVFPHHGLMP